MITTLRAGYVVKFLSTKGRSCASRRSGIAARVELNYPGLDSGTFTRDPAGAEMYEVFKVSICCKAVHGETKYVRRVSRSSVWLYYRRSLTLL